MTKTEIPSIRQQPKALYLLFFTELWERFGFYTLQTIIILYMTKALLMADDKANMLYAAFNSLLYLTPAIGGYLADRYLGFQRAIMIGGILLIIAYLVTAMAGEQTFFFGLSLLICANGFFKPNVSSLVGELYKGNDPKRDSGFTLFYMGINLGSLIPPIIAGSIVTYYGWHAGFILAAIGMTIGQIIFILGRKLLNGAGEHPNTPDGKLPGAIFYFVLSMGVILVIALCHLAFQYPQVTNYILIAAAGVILLVILFFLMKEPMVQRKKMLACLVLILISIGFWSLYTQTFTSLTLFADRNMSKHILGIPLDAESMQFFNPFFIILLSPILSRLWIHLDPYGLNPSIQMKFSLGVLFMSLGFLLLALGSNFFAANGMTSPWWLVTSYSLQTIGELLLSPIGLAMITVLCPRHLVGMMMGVWFFSQAPAFALGGMLANIAAAPTGLISSEMSLAIYSHAFTVYGLIAFVFAILSFALLPFLNRMINGNKNPRLT